MSEAFLQSYVLEKWFVSTIHRQSSAMIEAPIPWFYETVIWEWDAETRKRGKLVSMRESGRGPIGAAKRHAAICCNLVKAAIAKAEGEI